MLRADGMLHLHCNSHVCTFSKQSVKTLTYKLQTTVYMSAMYTHHTICAPVIPETERQCYLSLTVKNIQVIQTAIVWCIATMHCHARGK